MDIELNEAQVAYAQAILECGLIELDALQTWLRELTEAPNDLGEALSLARLINEFELTSALARLLGLSVATEIELEMYASPISEISREVCAELLIVPLSDHLVSPFPIACSNPLDEVGLDYLRELIGGRELKVSLSAPSHIRSEITACYGTEEEWLAYLASQGLAPTPMVGLIGGAEVSSDENVEVNSPLDQNGRPRTIPDWSSRCEDYAERVQSLNVLFDKG